MTLERFLNPIKSRIRLIVGRCIITACGGDTASISLLAGESRDDVDFIQQYGFSSRPVGNVSGVALFVGGSRDNGVVVATRGDDSGMAFDLNPGEVALHTKFGSSILLKDDGSIVVKPATGQVFRVDGGIEATMDVKSMCDTAPVSLTTHTHASAVGPTSPPTPGA